jgi:hypothetical protein
LEGIQGIRYIWGDIEGELDTTEGRVNKILEKKRENTVLYSTVPASGQPQRCVLFSVSELSADAVHRALTACTACHAYVNTPHHTTPHHTTQDKTRQDKITTHHNRKESTLAQDVGVDVMEYIYIR